MVLAAEGPVTYDVRKTDSLVSPLAGTIAFTTLSASDRADTAEAAKDLAVMFEGSRGSRVRTTLQFAHQGGAWVPTGGTHSHEHRRSGAEPFGGLTIITVDQAAMLNPWGPGWALPAGSVTL